MKINTDLIDDIQVMTGIDIPIEKLGLTIRQPTISDISMLGEENYFIALSIFKMSKEELKIENPEITNWKLFQESTKRKINGVKDTKVLLNNFLQLFFISKVIFGPRSLIIDQNGVLVNIADEEFDIFQEIISEIGGKSLLVPSEEEFNPRNGRAAAIAEKMKSTRKRVAAQKPKSKEKSKGFIGKYIRAVAIATSNSLKEINNMTLMQLNEIMQTYLAWEEYDLNIKKRLAGAGKDEDKLIHWTAGSTAKENDSIGTI